MSTMPRILLAAAAFGLMLGAEAGPASAGGTAGATSPSDAKYQCSDSHNSDTGHGANNSAGYQSTCDPADFGGNGQEFGPGLQTGKPCAGCVGNADDKNPPGQYPDGSDHNSGYECDGRDRPSANQQGNGNQGVGDENPAHTGCTSTATAPAAPATTPSTTAPATTPSTTAAPSAAATSTVTCPGGARMPKSDRNGDGVVDAADCVTPKVAAQTATPPVTGSVARPVSLPATPAVAAASVESPPAPAPAPGAPAAAMTPAPAVMGLTVEQPPEAAADPSPAVLGEQLEFGGGALPRTGPPSLLAESLAGLLLVGSGAVLVRRSRRQPAG